MATLPEITDESVAPTGRAVASVMVTARRETGSVDVNAALTLLPSPHGSRWCDDRREGTAYPTQLRLTGRPRQIARPVQNFDVPEPPSRQGP